jgi:hypothetical protein
MTLLNIMVRKERAAVLMDLFLERGFQVPRGVEDYDKAVWLVVHVTEVDTSNVDISKYLHLPSYVDVHVFVQDDGNIWLGASGDLYSQAAKLEAEKVLRAAGLGGWLSEPHGLR